MSATYPDYTYTNFPDNIDTFNYFKDITLENLPLAKQYYEMYNAGNIEGAAALLDSNPSLKQCFIGASTLNPIVDSVKALELFYMQDVQQYLVNLVQDKGDYSATTKYSKYNTVGYYIDGATETYICLSSNTPIGTLPTNTTYWRPITMRGEQGESGIGLAAKGAWSALVTYPADSMVSYNNALWASLIENVGIAPSSTTTATWYKLIEFSSDLLMFTDSTTGYKYQLTVNNGQVYLQSTNGNLNIALKSDIPTSLPANGGTAKTISDTLPISKGGTDATTAAGARTNIGAAAADHTHTSLPTTTFLAENTTNEGGQINLAKAPSYTYGVCIDVNGDGLRIFNTSGSVWMTINLSTGAVVFNGAETVNGTLTTTGTINAPNIELSSATPYIDFHYGSSAADYTSRIIEVAATVLQLAQSNTAYGTAQLRNIVASTTDLTAGSSALTNGQIYLVYE